VSPDYSYEWPPEADCPSCEGTGWYAEIDQEHPDGDLIDVRCPCYARRRILDGRAELVIVNDDWSFGPHTHRWIVRDGKTLCYFCLEVMA
jgi:hypothetical protein